MNNTTSNDGELIAVGVSLLTLFVMLPICCICNCLCREFKKKQYQSLYYELP